MVDEETKGMIHEISRDEIGIHQTECEKVMANKFLPSPKPWVIIVACIGVFSTAAAAIATYWKLEAGNTTEHAILNKTTEQHAKDIVALQDVLKKVDTNQELILKKLDAIKEDIRR